MPESNEADEILARAEHLAMLILNDGEIYESFLGGFIDRIGPHTGLEAQAWAGGLIRRRAFVVRAMGPVIDRAILVLSGRPRHHLLSRYDRGALRADRLHVAELMVEHYADRLHLIEVKS